jgi:O-antigen/teichoic acid export membrane protein
VQSRDQDREQPRETPPRPERASYRSGFFFGSLSFLGTAVLGLISTIITSRLYGVEIIGEYALVMAPVSALGLLSSVKEQKALIKEITGLPARHPRVGQLFGAVFSFSWALSAVVALIVAAICWFVFRGPLDSPELLAPTYVSIAGYVVVTNTDWNIDAIFSAFVAGRQLFWVRLHELLAFILIATAAGLAWHSVWALVAATIGAALSSLMHRVWAARAFVRPRLSWSEYRAGLEVLPELLRFGLKATPGQIAQGASQQSGVWALGVVASTSVVGAYSRALSLPQRLQQASLRITEVLYPTLVGRHSEGDGHGFDRALIDSIRYEVIGLLLIAAALGGAAHSVLRVFGPGFDQAAPALALLTLFPAMASVTVAQTQALWAVNRPGFTSLIAVARLAITIGLLIAITPPLGIVGPAIALLAGYVMVIVLSGIVLRPFLKRPLRATWPLRQRFALLGAYAAGFAAAHGVEQLVSSIPGVVLCLAAGTLAYAAAFLALSGLDDRDRRRLGELLARVRARLGGDSQPASSAKLGQSLRSICGKALARATTSSR